MIGEIIQFAGTTIPEGCLVCNGAAVSRTEYSELFSVIGTTYGQGDGSTTFNIPDMLGRAALGVDSTYTVGSSGGASDVLLDSTQIPLHTHSIPAHTHSNTIAAETPTITHSITAQPSYTYTHLNGTGKRGIIGSGANHFTRTSTLNMSRYSNLIIADHPATACTVSGGITDCPAFDTENAGSGAAHNNMMPYLAITYLIRATSPTPPVPIEPGMALYNGCCVVSAGGGYITGKTR